MHVTHSAPRSGETLSLRVARLAADLTNGIIQQPPGSHSLRASSGLHSSLRIRLLSLSPKPETTTARLSR